MNRKVIVGVLVGAAAGIIDVIPMILQKLTWDANLSAFSMWVVVGFFLSTTELRVKGFLKGLIVSYLMLIPFTFIIGWKEPLSLVPIVLMTTFLGATSGFIFEKLVNSRK